jgi:hypothetical protein
MLRAAQIGCCKRIHSFELAPPPTRTETKTEIPKLSSDPLLVKAYDLGLVDAAGDIDAHAVRVLLAGGGRGVFKQDGFFGYASAAHRRVSCSGALLANTGSLPPKHTHSPHHHTTPKPPPNHPQQHPPPQSAHVLLARALAWHRVNAVARGGEALRFILVGGTPGGGKATLFARLTQGPRAEYGDRSSSASGSGSGSGSGQKGAGGEGGGGGGGGERGAPAVDLRPLADPSLRGAQVVAFPGLRAREGGTAALVQSLAGAMAGGWSVVDRWVGR